MLAGWDFLTGVVYDASPPSSLLSLLPAAIAHSPIIKGLDKQRYAGFSSIRCLYRHLLPIRFRLPVRSGPGAAGRRSSCSGGCGRWPGGHAAATGLVGGTGAVRERLSPALVALSIHCHGRLRRIGGTAHC